MSKVPVGVLISGSGTNLQALLDAAQDADYPARIAVVVSNRPRALGLERARKAGVPTVFLSHRGLSRPEYDAKLVEALVEHHVEWVCLAGFMRIISSVLLDAFPWKILNIHPALLPSFPGLHGQEQAHQAGVRISGATVHLVDDGCDTGPIVAQGAVPVLQDDDVDALKERILKVEHQLYPMVLRWATEGRLVVQERKITLDLLTGEHPFLWCG
ncbi:MAG: phosphoribosylglycinamide formyltransferase [Proteobacteria bacterium]|jgi:phosphoribosylglycinamide formyltransferase 1|nr:phosphoribosylglycinamide formyltransferase [Pseudomonadota bacterium]